MFLNVRRAVALALVLTACGSGGGASVACEEFISRDREAEATIDLATQTVEDRGKTEAGSTVWRVTGEATVGDGRISFVCQVRHDPDQWVLEQLTYD